MVFSQSGYLRTLYYNFEQSKKVQGGAQVLIWTKDLSKCKSKCTLSGNNSLFVGSDWKAPQSISFRHWDQQRGCSHIQNTQMDWRARTVLLVTLSAVILLTYLYKNHKHSDDDNGRKEDIYGRNVLSERLSKAGGKVEVMRTLRKLQAAQVVLCSLEVWP